MAKKLKIEMILTGESRNGKIIRDNEQEARFALHHPDQKIMISYRPLSDMAAKEKLFNYLFGPLLDTFLNAMEDTGETGHSKNDWYLALKDKFAKEPWYNPMTKKEETRLLDFSADKTTASQLSKFVQDIVFFLEETVGVEAPDSSEFLMQKRLGPTKRTFNNE